MALTGRSLLFSFLVLSAVVSSPAAAQDLQPLLQSVPITGGQVHVGTWDGATGQRLPDDSQAATQGAGPVLVYDNSDFQGDAITFGSIVILLDWGELSAGGNNTITRVSIAYASNLATTDVIVRLNRGVNISESAAPFDDPGQGISIPLFGLPGDDGGDLTARFVDVMLPFPLPLEDGAIRYGLEFSDEDTFAVRVVPNGALNINEALQGYNAQDGSFYNLGGLPFTGINPSLFLQLFGTSEPLDPSQGSDRVLSGRDGITGLIDSTTDVDVLRYEALAGELLTVSVVGKGKKGLKPMLTITDLSTGAQVGTAGDGASNKAVLKKQPLTSSGAYAVRIESSGKSEGVYRARVSAKASPLAKQVTKPEGIPNVLGAFTAKAGATLSGVVKPASKSDLPLAAPTLHGPLGEVDISPWLILKGANTWRLMKVPAPAFGSYELRAGTEEGALELKTKLSLRPARSKGGRGNELNDALSGQWIKRDFVTPVTSFRATLTTARGDDDRFEQIQQTSGTTSKTTIHVRSWSVADAGIDELPDALRLSYRISPSLDVIKPFSEAGALNNVQKVSVQGSTSTKDLFEFEGGNPNVIRFLTSDEVWYREVSTELLPPEVTVETASGPGDGGGLVALRVPCVDGVAAFDVFKTPAGDSMPPSFALARFTPVCQPGEIPEDPDTAVWIDTGSASDGGAYDYWMAAVGEDGRRSVLAGPISAD
jgi:hypothetical protein